jgi:hypothetical protein
MQEFHFNPNEPIHELMAKHVAFVQQQFTHFESELELLRKTQRSRNEQFVRAFNELRKQIKALEDYTNGYASDAIVDRYNSRSDFPTDLKLVDTVAETTDSLGDRRLGKSIVPVLAKNREGEYWIIHDAEHDRYCLVPRRDAKPNAYSFETLEALYDCDPSLESSLNNDSYLTIQLIRSAIVSRVSDGVWKLETEGTIGQYSSSPRKLFAQPELVALQQRSHVLETKLQQEQQLRLKGDQMIQQVRHQQHQLEEQLVAINTHLKQLLKSSAPLPSSSSSAPLSSERSPQSSPRLTDPAGYPLPSWLDEYNNDQVPELISVYADVVEETSLSFSQRNGYTRQQDNGKLTITFEKQPSNGKFWTIRSATLLDGEKFAYLVPCKNVKLNGYDQEAIAAYFLINETEFQSDRRYRIVYPAIVTPLNQGANESGLWELVKQGSLELLSSNKVEDHA